MQDDTRDLTRRGCSVPDCFGKRWLGWQGPQSFSDHTKLLIFLECGRRLHIHLLHVIGTASKPVVLIV